MLKLVRVFVLAVAVGSFMASFHFHTQYKELKRSLEMTRQKNALTKQMSLNATRPNAFHPVLAMDFPQVHIEENSPREAQGTAQQNVPVGGTVQQLVQVGGTVQQNVPVGGTVQQNVPVGGTAQKLVPVGGTAQQLVPVGGIVQQPLVLAVEAPQPGVLQNITVVPPRQIEHPPEVIAAQQRAAAQHAAHVAAEQAAAHHTAQQLTAQQVAALQAAQVAAQQAAAQQAAQQVAAQQTAQTAAQQQAAALQIAQQQVAQQAAGLLPQQSSQAAQQAVLPVVQQNAQAAAIQQQQQPLASGGVNPVTQPQGVVVYDLKPNIIDLYDCVWLQNNPTAPVCLYDVVKDNFISADIKRFGTWEPDIIKKVQDALNRDPEMGFIDIGANIGVYTMTVASMNRKVLSVEPAEENLKRLHKAVKLAHVEERITALKNVISDKQGSLLLQLSPNNQGDNRAKPQDPAAMAACNLGPGCTNVAAVTLDDLVPYVQTKTAVMKMDIQGYEHKAFQAAAKLFEAVHIPCVFMEWELMKDFYVSAVYVSEDKRLVDEMIKFFTSRNYRVHPVQQSSFQELINIPWNMWTNDVVFVHQSML